MFEDGFTPESMVEWAEQMADEALEKMDAEGRIQCIRQVTAALLEYGILDADPTDPRASFDAAAQVLYICKLIPKVFPQAYNETEAELGQTEMAREKTIESLRRSFEL